MIIHIALFISAFLSFSCSTAFAGNSGIYGRVTNSYGYPLANVLVVAELDRINWIEYGITRIDMATSITTTDSEGFYSLTLPNGYYQTYTMQNPEDCSSTKIQIKVDNAMSEIEQINDRVDTGYGSLEGIVVDNHGFMVRGGRVRVIYGNGVSCRIDNEGHYILEELTPGFHAIGVSSSSHISAVCDSVWIEPGAIAECSFDEASGRCPIAMNACITGKVESSDGEPLCGATVMVLGTSYGAMTNSEGIYFIINLSEGDYTLGARYVGYKERTTSTLHVSSGELLEFNFTSDHENPNDPEGYALLPDYASYLSIPKFQLFITASY